MALSAAQQAIIASRGGAKGNLLEGGKEIFKVSQVGKTQTKRVSAKQYSAAASNAGYKGANRANY